MTTKEMFIDQVEKEWNSLRQNEDTIFENLEYSLNAEGRFEELKENYPETYMEIIRENSVYEKKKLIREYFWDRVVGPLYEHTLDIMQKAGILEEATNNLETSYKIETTARLILENGIFAQFPPNKKKELTQNLIEATFYPAMFYENSVTLDTEFHSADNVLEEGLYSGLQSLGRPVGNFITNSARTIKSLYLIAAAFLISPASMLMVNSAKQAVDTMDPGLAGKVGSNPTLRKVFSFFDKISPLNWIFTFLTQDQAEVFKYLRKANNLEDDYIQEILDDVGADSVNITKKCWDKNKIQLHAKNRESATTKEKIMHLLSGRGLSNWIRNPMYANTNQLILLLSEDAGDPIMQKRFYDFRVCIYEKLFEIIQGYAKAIYSMDDQSYEIIKRANDAHKNKNFKAFFDLRPKSENDKAMFKVMRTLVAIDNMARVLEDPKIKGNLAADKYITEFSRFLDQNIKETYKVLDEMANQRKFNLDRYEEEKPDEDQKAKAIQERKFNQKKSIFDDTED
jgi:hypothetical protein